MDLASAWRKEVQRELPGAIELRHELHADPRVSGDEEDTATALARAIGFGDGERVAGTGRLIPIAGPVGAVDAIAIRTELDGLPIVEKTSVSWSSSLGVMHACGHDVHMAGLAAVARATTRVDLPEPLVAILQPREEGADSGARDIVDGGWLEGIEAVIAAHVQPQLGPGVIAATPGPVNASTDELKILVTGTGGHSGYPHTVDDSVLALSSIVVALQQIGSRRIDPVIGTACMINRVQAGSAANVVPTSASAGGTVRTMRPADREKAHEAIREIVSHVAASHGCRGEVVIELGEPPLVNDVGLAVAAFPLLVEMGHAASAEFRSFGSDDFSQYCDDARGLMIFVGTGAEGGGLHDAGYLPGDEYVSLVADSLIAGYCAAVASRST